MTIPTESGGALPCSAGRQPQAAGDSSSRPPSEPTAETVLADLERHARYSLCRPLSMLSTEELFTATALSIRDRLIDRLLATDERRAAGAAKELCYLSIEYLVGPSLGTNLDSLGLSSVYRDALGRLGARLEDVQRAELDPGLGNGGLGRLAACFLDSLATLSLPAWGYGINYEYGLFRQELDNGYQREKPDNWLARSSPWQIERADEACRVPVYGRVEHALDRAGEYNPMWLDWRLLVGVPHDMLIAGHGGRTVQRLRLYSARSSQNFDMQIFNSGDYLKAVESKIASENVSKVLYPTDTGSAGKELRLLQEYFLVACAVRDMVRRFERSRLDFRDLPDRIAVQLNDTHPALAVVELMRILVDEKELPWDDAWRVTEQTIAYTNHTLAAEALERWPAALFERLLPRHLQLVHEINRRLMQRVAARFPGDAARLSRMSLMDDSREPEVRMSHLAMVGSHSINGVAQVHSRLVQRELAPDFHELWPERFRNVTNGVSQRRWLLDANPALAELITSRIGSAWIGDLTQLEKLDDSSEDPQLLSDLMAVKLANKQRLARFINDTLRVRVDPTSLFDVHAKRFHAYKRQLLKVLHIVHDYCTLIDGGSPPAEPRTYIFAGKAAPGYHWAKQTIKLINNVGRVVNADQRARDHIRIVFVPDYRVSLAELIIPAADTGEHISTPGTEASGTSNMKLALNGAINICTRDGANLELLTHIGDENLFMFGSTVDQIRELRSTRSYQPRQYMQNSPQVRRAVECFASGLFSPGEPALFSWVTEALLDPRDEHFHLADFGAYLSVQQQVEVAFGDRRAWARRALHNVARCGWFSSDRAVLDYARDIWHLRAL